MTGQPSFNDDEHRLFALPPHLGELGIVDPSVHSVFQFSASVEITAHLVQLILQHILPRNSLEQLGMLLVVITDHHQYVVDSYDSLLPSDLFLVGQMGSLSWLTAIPLSEHGFALHKGAFRDAFVSSVRLETTSVTIKLCLWPDIYSWACSGTVMWWLPPIRHNELRVLQLGFKLKFVITLGSSPLCSL